MIIKERIEKREIDLFDNVKVKDFYNETHITYCNKNNGKCHIKKLNKYEYILLNTGEIKEYKHSENRSQNKKSVAISCSKLRDLINYNVKNVDCMKWITLTYKENMRDIKKLYKDFDKFIKKLKYNLPKFEYISAVEPQERGAWHCHLLLFFDKKIWLPNNDIEKWWGHGFTKTTRLNKTDNIGAYLTAYLGDMELNDNETYDGDIKKVKNKRIAKGKRLELYPVRMNIYRCSRGIERVKPYREKYYKLINRFKNENYELYKHFSIRLIDFASDFKNDITYQIFKKRYDITDNGQLALMI